MLRAMTNLDRVRVGPVARPHPGRRRLAMPSQALMRQVIEQASEVRMIWQANEFRSEQFNLGPGRRHVEIERNIAAAFDIRRGGVGCPGPYECSLADLADDQALAFGLGIGLAYSADAEPEMTGEAAHRQQPADWPRNRRA